MRTSFRFASAGRPRILLVFAATWSAVALSGLASEQILDSRLHHLRCGKDREWTEFPAEAEGPEWRLTFQAQPNRAPYTLRLRHRDIKQTWRILIGDRELGRLAPDENPATTFWEIPPGTLREGDNTLRVVGSGPSDDVLIGDARLIDQSRSMALRESTLSVLVSDAGTGAATPARLTIVDQEGSLMSVGAESGPAAAVRPGLVYTADGRAEFGLPAGKYTIYAGRGFEFGVSSQEIAIAAGQRQECRLEIRHESPIPGYVSCDTHVHTFTYSRHGDATLAERLVTIAAEGLELPVATDHNLNIDYEPALKASPLRRYFSPVVGNEVTTPVGHFNVFPLDPAGPVPAHQGRDWQQVFEALGRATEPRVIVLNHPRDIHSGFRPFDPQRHIAIAGENLDGWKLAANALEVVNSGTLQTDPWRLVYDWCGLLNAGLKIAPVGGSDSHDVCRSIVGQARTYIRCPDEDPGNIDIQRAVANLSAGRVSVSFGLMADMVVNGRFGPGDLVPAADGPDLEVHVCVRGPTWTTAQEVVLLQNGREIRREPVEPQQARAGGIKYEADWKIPRPSHDAHLALVAIGPGISGLYWPTPKPYQPTSPDWTPYVLAVTGAVWIDADGDARFTAARDYAGQLIAEAQGDMSLLGRKLLDFDEAVAIQAASLLRAQGQLFAEGTQEKLSGGGGVAKSGLAKYVEAWKHSESLRGKP